MAESDTQLTSIKIPPEVRDKVRDLKRGQETYADLLDRMADQYTPEEPEGGQ